MNTSVEQLKNAGTAMRHALVIQDWAAIGELDLQCRQAVEEAMVEASNDEGMLRERLEELLALYKDLVAACEAEHQRIAGELLGLNQAQQGAKVYQLFS